MNVLHGRVAVAVASSAMLASCFGLTLLATSPAGTSAVTIASGASQAAFICPNATLVEAGACVPK
jgi:hypothetical protein